MCGERELRSKFDDAQEINRLNALGFNDLKGLKRKRNNQMRLVVAGQEPSNDEVSFSLQNLEFHFSRSFVKRKNLPLFVRNECLYSAVKVVTCLITSPTFVEVRNFTLNFYNRYRS